MEKFGIRHWLIALACLGLVAFVPGCGDDSDGDDDDTGGADTGMDEDTGGTDDTGMSDTGGSGDGLASHQDTYYRATFANVTRPAGLGALLSQLINNDIIANRLHVMIHLTDFGANTGDTTFMITGNGGQFIEGEGYSWIQTIDPETDLTYVPGDISADGSFANTETSSLDFPAPIPNTDPPEFVVLPIKELWISGTLTGDPLTMNGILEGAILEEDAAMIDVTLSEGAEPTPLIELLENTPMDYPEAGENATGWRVSATLIAEPVTFVPQP